MFLVFRWPSCKQGLQEPLASTTRRWRGANPIPRSGVLRRRMFSFGCIMNRSPSVGFRDTKEWQVGQDGGAGSVWRPSVECQSQGNSATCGAEGVGFPGGLRPSAGPRLRRPRSFFRSPNRLGAYIFMSNNCFPADWEANPGFTRGLENRSSI